MDELSVVYGDESLPRLYENSRVSLDQLPAQQGNSVKSQLVHINECLYWLFMLDIFLV